VRNDFELLQNASEIGIVNYNDLHFRHKNFLVTPRPAKNPPPNRLKEKIRNEE
jgi:hypothetical protein